MDEIKVVITLKGNKGAIGVQSPNCDPVIVTHEGSLQSLLETVPAVVEETNRRWDLNPRYPKCETKLKPQPTSRPTVPVSAPRRPQPAQPELQLF